MSETERPEAVATVKMVFAYDSRDTKDQTIQVWYLLDADGNVPEDEEQYKLYHGLVKKPWPGAVYEFTKYEDGKVNKDAPYHGIYEDDDLRRKWTTLHKGYHDTLRLEALERKGRKDDPFDPLLAKLRVEYNRLVGNNRELFLARVIARITRGVKL